jgi:hypothetical protein
MTWRFFGPDDVKEVAKIGPEDVAEEKKVLVCKAKVENRNKDKPKNALSPPPKKNGNDCKQASKHVL